MQEVEVPADKFAAFGPESCQLLLAVDLDQIHLHVGMDALLRHDLLELHPVAGATEDPRRGRVEADVNVGAHTRRAPSALREVADLLRGAAAVHRRGRVREDGLARPRVLDVLPDLRRVVEGVDRRHPVLPHGLLQARHLLEVLHQAGSNDEDVVLELLAAPEGDAVVGGVEGLAPVLDPLDAHGQHHVHRPCGIFHVEPQAADHGPVGHVVVRVPRLNDGDLASL
mmetsp:Transcript_9039/g.18539  ORF Transcript_9039/g.18539 Transcript_9039/m.18539 type:complete len:226 (-) Transcript_9039:223-900(-)